jgi:DNA helicase II / ATP-dependent DNA helicase PcrA
MERARRRIIADLHIHSRYSRACSKELTLQNIATWCTKKGIDLVGTGDFTHPAWFAELEEQLTLQENGFYRLETSGKGHAARDIGPMFVPTSEVSCIYTRDGRGRRVHIIIVAPTLDVVRTINTTLGKIGNIKHDGRPILGLDSEELAKIVFNASPECLVIPAHAWTPWFAIFGSKSGFDSIEECFGSMTKHIYAIETGLSSDPNMNARLSALDDITLISNSDAHSLPNLGREATVFAFDNPSYTELINAIRKKNSALQYTIEFFPEEGKYHVDGHRACDIRFLPHETKKVDGVCPACKKQLTVGVLNRIDALADRSTDDTHAQRSVYKSIVPLQEIISEVYGVGKKSKRVQKTYQHLVSACANEFSILLDESYEHIAAHTEPLIVLGIRRVREGRVTIEPGYDGVFGRVRVFSKQEIAGAEQQELEL